MEEKIYKVYWCTNWLGKYDRKFLGIWDSIRNANKIMRKHTSGYRDQVHAFIVEEYTIYKCPKYKELLTQKRYCEVNLNGKINVIRKCDFVNQEVKVCLK